MKNNLLKNFIKFVIKESFDTKKLRVFDLDDTLVKTNSKVIVHKNTGEVLKLTPGEYAVYEPSHDDEFDFSEFEGLIDPESIVWTTKILRNVIQKHGTDGAVILTARGNKEAANQFFELNDIPRIPVVALASSDPYDKSRWIEYVAKKFGYQEIEFFDDSYKNVEAANSIIDRRSGKIRDTNTRLIIRHIDE
jgi:hypothetical protein